jgi:cytochrome bd-type quinol oxidase subunit 2
VIYVHPVLGGVVLVLLLYTASLGIRSRGRTRQRARLLAQHARIAPVAFALVAATWVAGAVSTALLRNDMTLAESTHFRLGSGLLVVLAAGLWTSRAALRGSENAREIHVWLGVAATLLGFAQAFMGLRITP